MEVAFSYLLSHLTLLGILFWVSSVRGVAMVKNCLMNFPYYPHIPKNDLTSFFVIGLLKFLMANTLSSIGFTS